MPYGSALARPWTDAVTRAVASLLGGGGVSSGTTVDGPTVAAKVPDPQQWREVASLLLEAELSDDEIAAADVTR